MNSVDLAPSIVQTGPMTGHMTEREHTRAETRERQRELLRAAPGNLLRGLRTPDDVKPDALVEDRLRDLADGLLKNEPVQRFLSSRGQKRTVDACRDAILALEPPAPVEIAAMNLIGSVTEVHEPAQRSEVWNALVAFVTSAVAADYVADDGYRDPRIDS